MRIEKCERTTLSSWGISSMVKLNCLIRMHQAISAVQMCILGMERCLCVTTARSFGFAALNARRISSELLHISVRRIDIQEIAKTLFATLPQNEAKPT